MARYSKTAEKLLPHLLQELSQVQPVIIAQAGDGGSLAVHALDGEYHTGTLDESQAPWAVTAAVFGAHEADPDAHHARATVVAPVAVSGQQISLNYAAPLTVVAGALDVALGDGVEESGGSLRVKLPTNTGIARDSTGLYLSPSTLNITTTNAVSGSGHAHAITTTTTGAVSTIVALDANGYTTAARWIATDRVRTPSLDTASGDMTVAPAGDLTLNPGGGEIFIPGADTLRSSAWTSGVLGTGWGIQERGGAGRSHLDIRSIYCDELIATTFTADQVRVRSGSDWLGEALAIAARDNSDNKITIPNVGGGAVRIYVEDAPEVTGQIFSTNEYVLIKTINRSSGLVIRETWGQVSSYIDEANGRQSYSWTTVSGSGSFTLEPGTALSGFGVSSGSYIFRTVIEAGRGPYERFATWSGNPYTPANRVSRVEIGDIKNAAGDSTTRYGIAAGNNLALTPATGFSGFTADSVNGARLYNGLFEIYSSGTRYLRIDTTDGITITPGDAAINKITWETTGGVAYANSWSYHSAPSTLFTHEVRAASATSNSTIALEAKSSAGDIAARLAIAYTYADGKGAIGATADTFAVGKTGTIFEVSTNAGANSGTYMVDRAFVVISGVNHSVWHAGNDGSGSGLDADKLDTYEATAFGRLAASQTWTANQQINASLGIGITPSQLLHIYGSSPKLMLQSSAANQAPEMYFYDDASLKGRLLYAGGNSAGAKYFGFIANADYLGFFSDTHRFWNYAASVRYADMSSTAVWLSARGTSSDLYVDASGYVLINTSSNTYSARLNVSGNIHGDAAITAENFFQLKQRSGSPGSATGFGRIYYDSGDDKLKYITSGGTVRTLSYT